MIRCLLPFLVVGSLLLQGCGAEGFDPTMPVDAPRDSVRADGEVSPSASVGIDSGDLIVHLRLTSSSEDTVVVEWSPCSLEPRAFSDEDLSELVWVHEPDPPDGSAGTCSSSARTDTIAPGRAARMTRYLPLWASRFGAPDADAVHAVELVLNGERVLERASR